jgi:hypothetical protein
MTTVSSLIVELYRDQQLSSYEVSGRLAEHGINMTPETIRNKLMRLGVPLRTMKEARRLRADTHWTDEIDEGIRRLWRAGVKGREIVSQLGLSVSHRAVYQRASRLGLPPRQIQPPRKGKKPVPEATPEVPVYRPEPMALFADRPDLQAQLESAIAAVRQERGEAWTRIEGTTR